MDNFAITHLKLWKYINVRNNYLCFMEIYRNQTDYTLNCFIYLCWNTHLVDNKYYYDKPVLACDSVLYSIYCVGFIWSSTNIVLSADLLKGPHGSSNCHHKSSYIAHNWLNKK
jgi:hypothetical protein